MDMALGIEVHSRLIGGLGQPLNAWTLHVQYIGIGDYMLALSKEHHTNR